ncbi:Rad52/Rad22 family DNA repair protein [Desulfurobacterium crinifex]
MAVRKNESYVEIIKAVDEILDSYGEKAIQEVPSRGRVLHGYVPQFVFDALNEVIGAGNWGYEILNSNYAKEVRERKNGKKEDVYVAVVHVRVWMMDKGNCKEAFGGSENYTAADALKGATTDAVQKALAMFSIGHKAYRGELAPAKEDGKKGDKSYLQEETGEPASEKQKKLIKKLAKERGMSTESLKEIAQELGFELNSETLTKFQASQLIERVKNFPKVSA